MNVICLKEDAFYALLDKVFAYLDVKRDIKTSKWISGPEAMQRLSIKSKSTLQKYRDEGRIRFAQPDRKIILYDADSIDEYLEKHAKEPF